MKCKNCIRFKTLRLNLLKKENAPRVYYVECGLTNDKNKDCTDCEYYEKKTLKNVLENLKYKK